MPKMTDPVKSFFQAHHKADMELFDTILAHHFRAQINGKELDREGEIKFIKKFLNAFHDIKFKLKPRKNVGTLIIVDWTAQAVHGGSFARISATGNKVTLSGKSVFKLIGNRIKRLWMDWNEEELKAELKGQ